MTWLTKLSGDTRHQKVRRDIHDVHEAHRSVMALFPHVDEATARNELGVLYRVESQGAKSVILVQSEVEPTGTPDGYVLEGSYELDAKLASLHPGTKVRYCILANATKSIPVPKARGKVKALLGADAVEWWKRRSAQAGLVLLSEPTWTTHPLTGKRQNGKIHVVATRFEGIAEITDVQQLTEVLTTGLGRAKAYGCGMLSIAPMHY
jgi:CRISPR system Cascade subunit CasE